MNSLKCMLILCLACLLEFSVTNAASTTTSTPLVMGLGPGLVGLIILGLICLIILIFGYSAEYRNVFFGFVAFIIGMTVLFILTVRVKSPEQTQQDDLKYNTNAVIRGVIAGIMIFFAVISLFAVLLMHIIKPRQGFFIGESAHQIQKQRLF